MVVKVGRLVGQAKAQEVRRQAVPAMLRQERAVIFEVAVATGPRPAAMQEQDGGPARLRRAPLVVVQAIAAFQGVVLADRNRRGPHDQPAPRNLWPQWLA